MPLGAKIATPPIRLAAFPYGGTKKHLRQTYVAKEHEACRTLAKPVLRTTNVHNGFAAVLQRNLHLHGMMD